jgi:hypothetical protein
MEKITQITTLGQMVPAAKRKPGVGAGLRMDTCMGERQRTMQRRQDNTDHDPSSRIGGGVVANFLVETP